MAVPINASIVEHFQTLEDPRIERTKQHPLLDILVIALCTLLTGGEGFQDMELFGKSKHGISVQAAQRLPHSADCCEHGRQTRTSSGGLLPSHPPLPCGSLSPDDLDPRARW